MGALPTSNSLISVQSFLREKQRIFPSVSWAANSRSPRHRSDLGAGDLIVFVSFPAAMSQTEIWPAARCAQIMNFPSSVGSM